ncbi:uncharacterized protein LJ206_008577 isoform 2-T2 [Theristicus caerulescens]
MGLPSASPDVITRVHCPSQGLAGFWTCAHRPHPQLLLSLHGLGALLEKDNGKLRPELYLSERCCWDVRGRRRIPGPPRGAASLVVWSMERQERGTQAWGRPPRWGIQSRRYIRLSTGPAPQGLTKRLLLLRRCCGGLTLPGWGGIFRPVPPAGRDAVRVQTSIVRFSSRLQPLARLPLGILAACAGRCSLPPSWPGGAGAPSSQPGRTCGRFSALFSCQPCPVAPLARHLHGSAAGLRVPHPSWALRGALGSRCHNANTFILTANAFSSSSSASITLPAVQERAISLLFHPGTCFFLAAPSAISAHIAKPQLLPQK